MLYWSVLGSNFEKPLSHLRSAPSNLPCCNVLCKKWKFLNLGLKMSDFRILGLEFENIIVIFEISVLNLSSCKVWCKNENLRIWDQECLIWVILGWNLKMILSYLIWYSQICLSTKFREKTKTLKFGIKNALFVYFCTRISKNYCHI